jgi:hypothetical protein
MVHVIRLGTSDFQAAIAATWPASYCVKPA